MSRGRSTSLTEAIENVTAAESAYDAFRREKHFHNGVHRFNGELLNRFNLDNLKRSILSAEQNSVVDCLLQLLENCSAQALLFARAWYERIKLENPDYIVFSIGSSGSKDQTLPPFVTQNPHCRFAVLNIDPGPLSYINHGDNYSCAQLQAPLQKDTALMQFLKQITRELMTAGKKVILMTFPTPIYCKEVQSWLTDSATRAYSQFCYVLGYADIAMYPIIVCDKNFIAKIGNDIDIEQEARRLFPGDEAEALRLPLLEGTKRVPTVGQLKLADFDFNPALDEELDRDEFAPEEILAMEDPQNDNTLQKVAAFEAIYSALRDGQSGLIKTNFLKELRSLMTPKDKLDAIEEHAKKMGSRTEKAWELAQLHYANCNNRNLELFASIYDWSFSQSGLFKKSLVAGTTLFKYNEAIQYSIGLMTEDQLKAFARDNANSRTAKILWALEN